MSDALVWSMYMSGKEVISRVTDDVSTFNVEGIFTLPRRSLNTSANECSSEDESEASNPARFTTAILSGLCHSPITSKPIEVSNCCCSGVARTRSISEGKPFALSSWLCVVSTAPLIPPGTEATNEASAGRSPSARRSVSPETNPLVLTSGAGASRNESERSISISSATTESSNLTVSAPSPVSPLFTSSERW